MSRDTLTLGLQEGGGVLPGPLEGVEVGSRPPLPGPLEGGEGASRPPELGSAPLPGPPPDLIRKTEADSDEDKPGGPLSLFSRGGGALPGPPPDLLPTNSTNLGDGRGGQTAGVSTLSSQAGSVTTLTTPTLTPTTLRNIEQMFADRDPHEPPHYHQNAAGFVPPIISPTSGNSYVPMGQVAPLNCHRDSNSISNEESPPSPDESLPQPALPSLQHNGPSDLTINNGESGPPPLTKPTRPTNLGLPRAGPPPLMEAPVSRPRMLPLLRSPPPAPDLLTTPVVEEEQQQPSDLSITVRERPRDLNIGQMSLGNGAGQLISHKLDIMDKFLKAVAASPVMQSNMSIVCSSSEQETNLKQISPNNNVVLKEEPPSLPVSSICRKTGGRKPSQGDGEFSVEEEKRRVLRRERNKQAAARCRKRRLDLTSSLQGEVDQWEDKVRSLKEELLQLESQKKGLEAVLRRHQGPCKLAKTDGSKN